MSTTHQYYVYILANHSKTLYVGVTNDLLRRVHQHKHRLMPGFTAKYNVDRLVYFESTHDVNAAITRERALKGWLRAKKVALIESCNPAWEDLSADWFDEVAASAQAEQDPSHSLRMTATRDRGRST